MRRGNVTRVEFELKPGLAQVSRMDSTNSWPRLKCSSAWHYIYPMYGPAGNRMDSGVAGLVGLVGD